MLTKTEDKTPKGLIGLTKMFLALPGESLQDFSKQYKELTDKDKADFRAEFESYGYVIKDPA